MSTPSEEMVNGMYRAGVRYINVARSLTPYVVFTHETFLSLAQTKFSRREPDFYQSVYMAYHHLMDRYCPISVHLCIVDHAIPSREGLTRIASESNFRGIIGKFIDGPSTIYRFSDPSDTMMFKLQVG